jgi:hypothetical protein
LRDKIAFFVICFLLICALFLNFQTQQSKELSPETAIRSFDKIKIKFGCESEKDKIIINGDGQVEYPTILPGKILRLSTQQTTALIAAINEARYFSLAEKMNKPNSLCLSHMTDTAWTEISVTVEKKTAKIQYSGTIGNPKIVMGREKICSEFSSREAIFERKLLAIINTVPLPTAAMKKLQEEENALICF